MPSSSRWVVCADLTVIQYICTCNSTLIYMSEDELLLCLFFLTLGASHSCNSYNCYIRVYGHSFNDNSAKYATSLSLSLCYPNQHQKETKVNVRHPEKQRYANKQYTYHNGFIHIDITVMILISGLSFRAAGFGKLRSMFTSIRPIQILTVHKNSE